MLVPIKIDDDNIYYLNLIASKRIILSKTLYSYNETTKEEGYKWTIMFGGDIEKQYETKEDALKEIERINKYAVKLNVQLKIMEKDI